MPGSIKHVVSSIQDPAETGMAYHITREFHLDGTFDILFCVGLLTAPGRSRWVTVTAANTPTQKNTAVLAALLA